jgi:hypothetical protein
MRTLYCWRCRRETPMLSEEEYQFVMSFVSAESGLPFGERQENALEAYRQITGDGETGFAVLYHHRLALYGPPCHFCHKPLRTPRASLCGCCMKPIAVSAHRVN